MHAVRIAALALAAFGLPVVTAPAQAAAPVTCSFQTATIVGTPGADHLVGTGGDDVIVALGGDDRVEGRGGRDIVCGGKGNDVIQGGAQTDRLRGQEGDDRLVGGKGGRVYLDGGPGNDRLTSAATARSILFGRSGDDTLTTSSFELSLFSEAGDDTITTTHTEFVSFDARAAPVGIRFDAAQGLLTGRGHTELHFAPGTTVQLGGSSHDDVLIGTAGVDVLEGAGGADLVRAGHGADVIAFSGADHVHGGRGNDLLHGTFVPGTAQVVDGGPGANQLLAKLSTRRPTSVWDHVLIDLGTDAFEADGKTTALAGVFTSLVLDGRATRSLTVLGTGGADSFWLHKGSPDTVVDAGAGNDVLRLGAGDDTIDGGNGNDTADAGAGNDTCTSVETPTRCETSTP